MKVLGLDIGGAYIKAALVEYEGGEIRNISAEIEYFPIWKDRDGLTEKLKHAVTTKDVERLGVTTTVEVSDAFPTKREAINKVLDSVEEVFMPTPAYVLTTEPSLITVSDARKKPYLVGSANWIAAPWFLSLTTSEGIVVDMGSTTTDIVPIKNGKVAALGKTDLDRLANGELVYTGALRTNLATIVDTVPVRGKVTRVSSEYFAITADVYRVLEKISEKEYSCETPNGRGKDKQDCLSRIARLICSDTETLTEEELIEISRYIQLEQVRLVNNAVKQVTSNINLENPRMYIAGVGSFLLRDVAGNLGLSCEDLSDTFGKEAAIVAPCIGLAVMTAREK